MWAITKRIVFVILLVWLSGPIVGLFGTWERAVDTGNDTQYSLMALGFCVGAAVVLSRRGYKLPLAEVAQVVAKYLRSLLWLSVRFAHSAPDSPCPFAILRI